MAEASKITELITMASTISKHIKGILAYWSTGGMTSASMEGFSDTGVFNFSSIFISANFNGLDIT